ncbi:MAG TPA: 2-amino-4-hydroxy-6-hydroxymethyldihydropteridine diphosphokinase [Methylophilaceae bacterium]|nr:2-amino-4-hydroxy-6-hydroxymethyldihydropteridine diphosphokinase [Methylophilaceae bacterium]
MSRAFIAIGSNLQQPRIQVEQAFAGLDGLPQTRVIQRSSLYRTAPVGYDNQPNFINAVAEVETDLTPLALLHELLALENKQGRERPFPNAPRVLDLDLLLYNDTIMNMPELTLPHPRMHTRGFVLLPLAELAAELVIPQRGTVAELAAQCLDQGVEKLVD